jgi:hypothetical protein
MQDPITLGPDADPLGYGQDVWPNYLGSGRATWSKGLAFLPLPSNFGLA